MSDDRVMKPGRTTGSVPNLFIVGAAKAGTTSLHAYLDGHPDVFMSAVKEPHFYSRVRAALEQRAIMGHVVRDETAYRRLFEGAAGFSIVGESSPSYLWDPATPARIRQEHPEARIVAILRDPVERAFSHYLMDIHLGVQTLPFLEALEEDAGRAAKGWGISHLYVELGYYGEQLERYYREFPPEQILVLLFDDLVSEPIGTLRRLLEFLDLDPSAADTLDTDRSHNAYVAPRGELARRMMGSGAVRDLGRLVPRPLRRFVRRRVLQRQAEKPSLPDDARQRLASLYAGDTQRLERLLGRRVPWGAA